VWLAQQVWQVVSPDLSDVAQPKAAELAAQRGVTLDLLVQADVHAWDYPPAAFDLVADIFLL
jgi:hypothetical protein